MHSKTFLIALALLIGGSFFILLGVWKLMGARDVAPLLFIEQIEKAQLAIAEKISPVRILSKDELQSFGNDQLAVEGLYPQLDTDLDQQRRLLELTRSCSITENKSQALPGAKEFVFEKAICNKTQLSPDFFVEGNFAHPFGGSYVFWAMQSGMNLDWNRLKKGIHVGEFRYFSDLKLTEAEKILGSLKIENLSRLNQNKNLAIDEKMVLWRSDKGEYGVYRRNDFLNVFNKLGIQIGKHRPYCPNSWQGICWKYRSPSVENNLQRAWAFFSIAMLLVISGTIVLITHRIHEKKRLEQDRQLIMQTLTHELRTPATSLELSLENIRQEFDQLPENGQKEFLRMCDEIQRLRRVIHASKQYMQSTHQSGKFAIRKDQISSVNEFCKNIADEFAIGFTPLAKDESIATDPYWLKVCLENLVKNALTHGQGKVVLQLKKANRQVAFTVKDEGQSSLNPDEIFKPFSKGTKSKGMGLGLSIASRIIEIMKGRLAFEERPTRFTIFLEANS